ncbi:MAG: RecG wedge domain, partial [Candidatus Parcubacteria bacterium]
MFSRLPLTTYFNLKPDQKKALHKLGLETLQDLLYYFPKKYIENTESVYIEQATDIHIENEDTLNIQKASDQVFYGRVSQLKTGKT